jgi:hypothetical protein
LLVFLILGAAAGWVMPVVEGQSTATPQPDALVIAEGLNVRRGPGATYSIVTAVVENDPLVVLGRDANCRWLLVRTPQEIEGWVSKTYVELHRTCASIDIATTTTGGTGTAAPTLAPASAGKQVVLVRPLTARIGGRVVFEWRANFALEPGQLFELVLWAPGREPMADSFSPIGAGPATQVTVNFDRAIASMSQLEAGADYHWGVLLVTLNPYRRIQYLGGGHRFRLGGSTTATLVPGDTPTNTPTLEPGDTPTDTPTSEPATLEPGDTPVDTPTLEPGDTPTDTPTATPAPADTSEPGQPTEAPADTPEPDTPEPEQPTEAPADTPEPEQPTEAPADTPEPEQPTEAPADTPEGG